MAPEIAGVLVVADLQFDGEELVANVDEVEMLGGTSAHETLRVRWNTTPQSSDYQALGGGVVYVGHAAGLNVFHAHRAQVDSLGRSRFAWIHFARQSGLMFVLVLPKGFTIAGSEPSPRSAKVFKDRIAIYFRPEIHGDAGPRVSWELKELGVPTQNEVQRINRNAAKSDAAPLKGGARIEDTERLSAKGYAILAAFMLVFSVGLLLFYVHEVPKLIENGVENRIFYILLIPWGLSAALFLFATMRSTARFTHKGIRGSFELSGPAALFFIIVFRGYQMVQNVPEPFDLTVRAHSADGAVPLVKEGKITLELGTALRTEEIASNGEANFKGLLSTFKGTTIRVLPEVDGYKSDWQSQKLVSNVLNLALARATPLVTHFTGSIVPPPKNWTNINIRVDGSSSEGKVDDLGRFDFPVAGKDGERIRLKIYVDTALEYDDYQTLPGPVTLNLHSTSHQRIKTPVLHKSQ
jgi:hypothetical protein